MQVPRQLKSEIPEGAYIIGKSADLVAYEAHLADDDPRRGLLQYHVLRNQEAADWGRSSPRAALASEDPEALERLNEKLAALEGAYSPEELGDFPVVASASGDAVVADLCGEYIHGTSAARTYIRSAIAPQEGWRLLTYSKRAAIQALRRKDRALLFDSLVAHAVEDLAAGDVRDNLVALGLCYHCARRIDDNPREIFLDIALLSSPAIRQLLTDFVRRDDLDGILSAMGWVEVQTPRGPGFRWH